MTYADNYNIRTTSVKFNDVGDALDGLITRNYAGVTSGTSTTYIATPTPAWDAYTTSGLIVIIPHTSNSGAATINISGLGAKDLKIGGAAIAAGVLQTGIPTIMAYTGTYFEVLLQNVSIPTGQVSAFAGSSAPTGWLLCDATSYNTYTYRVLHAVISNTYGGTAYNPGVTDQPAAVTTFNVPDLLRRAPIGKGASDTLGGSDGVAYASRSMSHSHTVPAHYHGVGAGATLSVDISHSHAASSVTGSVGGADGTHTHGLTGDGSHDHDLKQEAGGGGTADGSAANILALVGSTVSAFRNSSNHYTGGAHTHTVNNTGSAHGHLFSLIAAGQTLGATAKTPTGLIGLVTGGVDGNVAMTSGSATSPHLFVNYIIKF
jgi:microcystin-dependent protein